MTELEQLKKENAELTARVDCLRYVIEHWNDEDIDIENILYKAPSQSLYEIQREAIDSEEHNLWKRAVIDQLVVSNILSEVHYNDPEKAIKDLLVFESEIAIDPRISKAAIDLQREAMEKAIDKACNRLKLFGFGEPGNDDPVVLIRNMPLPLEDE